MEYEVEFHPVGDASKTGDAITIRYGANGIYNVMVVDGGAGDTGEILVDHIKAHYGINTVISDVVSSHPDTDHASGLRAILRSFPVQRRWAHGLWDHAGALLPYMADKRWTVAGLTKDIRDSYPIIAELRDLAAAQGTTILEPFAGQIIGPFIVLSPTAWAYQRLLAQFRKTPEADTAALEAEGMLLPPPRQSAGIFGGLQRLVEAAQTWIGELWDVELLREGAITAAENETSTVLLGQFSDGGILLTGDAGANALHWSIGDARARGIDLSTIKLVQIPHHGSRSNVTPSVLDSLIGPRLPLGTPTRIQGIVSCPRDDESHPRKMVMNAFRRRGVAVFKTQGSRIRFYSRAMGQRPGDVDAAPFGWFDRVEAYD
jgi:beta-lactamase superfamily II metal-dependent hydrolase